MADMAFRYVGEVGLSLKHNGHVTKMETHNAGDTWLFKTFAKYLTGNATGADSEIPTFVDLRSQPSGGGDWTSQLARTVRISSRYFENDQTLGWVARLTATITYDDLISYIPDGDTRNFRIYLYSDKDNTPGTPDPYHDVAHVDVTSRTLSNISPGVILIIEWCMRLTNA